MEFRTIKAIVVSRNFTRLSFQGRLVAVPLFHVIEMKTGKSLDLEAEWDRETESLISFNHLPYEEQLF